MTAGALTPMSTEVNVPTMKKIAPKNTPALAIHDTLQPGKGEQLQRTFYTTSRFLPFSRSHCYLSMAMLMLGSLTNQHSEMRVCVEVHVLSRFVVILAAVELS